MTLAFRLHLVLLLLALGTAFASGVFAVLSFEQRAIMSLITMLWFASGYALGCDRVNN